MKRNHKLAPMRKAAITVTVTLAVIGLVLGFFIPGANQGTDSPMPPAPASPGDEPTANLGITYLPLTPGLADHYGLGVKTGAYITEVFPDSLAEKAGLKVGDVIMSYNGVAVESGNSLLEAIRNCPVGTNVVVEINRAKTTRTISFVHGK